MRQSSSAADYPPKTSAADRRNDPAYRAEVGRISAELKRNWLVTHGTIKEIPDSEMQIIAQKAREMADARISAAPLSETEQQALIRAHEKDIKDTARNVRTGFAYVDKPVVIGETELDRARIIAEEMEKQRARFGQHGEETDDNMTDDEAMKKYVEELESSGKVTPIRTKKPNEPAKKPGLWEDIKKSVFGG